MAFETDLPSFMGIDGLPMTTPYGALFLGTREVLPGLGIEGEALLAHALARAIVPLRDKR